MLDVKNYSRPLKINLFLAMANKLFFSATQNKFIFCQGLKSTIISVRLLSVHVDTIEAKFIVFIGSLGT